MRGTSTDIQGASAGRARATEAATKAFVLDERAGDMVGDMVGDTLKRDTSVRGWSSHARGWQLRLLLLLGLALALGLAGCTTSVTELSNAPASIRSNVVELGISSFMVQQVTIHAGQSVVFDDSAPGGGVHYLCVGKNQRCQPTPGAPAQLSLPQGLLFKNGQRPVNIQFTTPGDYEVICIIHPGMEMHVVVK